MTAQLPDKLANNHLRVNLDGLYLYSVVRGHPRTPPAGRGGRARRRTRQLYGPAFSTQPTHPDSTGHVICSELWRGYVAEFVLQPDGRLRLIAFEHMTTPSVVGCVYEHRWRKQEVDELLGGDFWIGLCTHFVGGRDFGGWTYIPFRAGVIVEDREQWFIDESFTDRMKRYKERQQEVEPSSTADTEE